MNVFADLSRDLVSRPGDPPPRTVPAKPRPRPAGKRQGPPLPLIANPWGLSAGQAAVLQHMVEGRSNEEMAASLGVSKKTIEAHRARALEKIAASNSIRAAILWDRFIREGQRLPEQEPRA
jgi:DNA-binding NarL/FixJ family response regulator